jgi:hypothetical protein
MNNDAGSNPAEENNNPPPGGVGIKKQKEKE